MYRATTNAITVTVIPVYCEDQSDPEGEFFVWAYKVRIENDSAKTVQLRSRYWTITDVTGLVQEVRGDGVLGEQPVIRPGESFEYNSGTSLMRPSGIMVGTYQMETEDGDCIDVSVPAFSLDSPYQAIRLN
jgi:ApaG protein